MPRLRFQPPDRLPGATAFSQDEDLCGSMNVVRLLKARPEVLDDLRKACDLSVDWGRGREAGHWELAMAGFVVSGHVDVQPWLAATGEDFWRECGFESKPRYRTTWRRMRELEEVSDAFLQAAGKLIRRARKHDSRVFAHAHFDNTEDETHAALVHDCKRGECPKGGAGHASGKGKAGRGNRPTRVPTQRARDDRQAANAEMPPEAGKKNPRLRLPDKVEFVTRKGRKKKRVLIGGCWFITGDLDGGIRAYMGERGAKRFWHGYYSGKAADHLTGGCIPHVTSASEQEYDLFVDHYDKVKELVGEAPQTVVGDKGLSIEKVFEKCTRNGTATVVPWRPGGGDGKRHDKPTHDRHGIPRCKHCGGPTTFVRFSPGKVGLAPEDRDPRIWVSCTIGATEGCEKDQTIACAGDFRLLVPLWRTDGLYHELKKSHGSYEGAHDWWRDRYKVAADTLALRPKVRSIGWHRLRASAACLVEWLRICLREGWLGSARRNHRDSERSGELDGKAIADSLAAKRVRMGLAQPYGDKAVELGLGERVPPSRRPRGAPPGQTTLDIED